MLDPRELYATHRDHLLCRILDLERALPLRPYGAEGRVVFELRDEMCPWNAGRWALEAGAEGATVSRTKESPQLTLDVSALVQMLFGQVSPSQCRPLRPRRGGARTRRSICGTRCGAPSTRRSARTGSDHQRRADVARALSSRSGTE